MASQAERDTLSLTSRREKKKISLEEISQVTKIGVRSLQAIEAGEFQKLPGGIYSTSYIRQYAKAVDFDESEILAAYYSVMGINLEAEQAAEQPHHAEGSLVSRVLRHTSAVLGSL